MVMPGLVFCGGCVGRVFSSLLSWLLLEKRRTSRLEVNLPNFPPTFLNPLGATAHVTLQSKAGKALEDNKKEQKTQKVC